MAYNRLGGLGVITTNYTTANPCNIQTLDNIIQLCDDLEIANYTANDTLLTLSDSSMRPDVPVVFPICVTEGNQTRTAACTLHTDGTFTLPFSYTDAIVHFNGICIHVNSKYYTPAIGNIYNNGTSPLDAN